jgi:hypothetical protein
LYSIYEGKYFDSLIYNYFLLGVVKVMADWGEWAEKNGSLELTKKSNDSLTVN